MRKQLPTVYLHVGRGQTGTTAIQRLLSKWRPRLREQGIQYLVAGDASSGGHQKVAKSLIRYPPTYMEPAAGTARIRKRVLREIERSSAPAVLLSSENFALAEISEVRSFFSDYEVQIILFARSQDELAESEYNEMVKRKRETKPFSEFVESRLETYDFDTLAGEWAHYFGEENLTCRVYDGRRRDVISQFFTCLPVVESPISEDSTGGGAWGAENSSLGYQALSIVRRLNGVELSGRERLYRRIVSQTASDDLPALLMGSEEARALRARYSESNLSFSSRFLGSSMRELGGRRYGDQHRDEIRERIQASRIDS